MLEKEVIEQFLFEENFQNVVSFGNGHINETYLLTFQGDLNYKRYIIQKMNTDSIASAELLMDNIFRVTEYLKEKIKAAGGNPNRETLTFLRTKDGKMYYQAEDGSCYRAMEYLEGMTAYDAPESARHFQECGRLLGRFQKYLADFSFKSNYTNQAKDFHNTKMRYGQFCHAVKEDTFDRVGLAEKEIEFVKHRKADTEVLVNLLEAGKLTLRVTHNDPKVSNFMMDTATGEALTLIDLDTVMPGLSLYDYGDAIRSGAKKLVFQDGRCVDVKLNRTLFESFTKGYLEEAGDFLSPLEKKYLFFSIRLMSLECGMRYLTDFLCGDVYFRKNTGMINLEKARREFLFVRELEELDRAEERL